MSYNKAMFFNYGSASTDYNHAWLAPRIFEVGATSKTNKNNTDGTATYTCIQLVPAVRVNVTEESSKSRFGIAISSCGSDVTVVHEVLSILSNTSAFKNREMMERRASRFEGLSSPKDRLNALVGWAETASVAIKEGVNSRDNERSPLHLLDSQVLDDRIKFLQNIFRPISSTDKMTGLLNESDSQDKFGVATRPIVYQQDTERGHTRKYTLQPLMICWTRPPGASSVTMREAARGDDLELYKRFGEHKCDVSNDDLKPIATMLHSADVGDTHKAISAYRDKIIDLWSGFATENGLKLSDARDATSGLPPPQDDDQAQWGEWKGNVGSENESDSGVWGPWRSNTGEAEQ